MQVQVNGQHYNIGTNNILIRVYRQSDSQLLYENDHVSAIHAPGKPAGSFEVKTSVVCPTTFSNRVHVYAVDTYTNRYRDKIYP
jgi:hypothetical protein